METLALPSASQDPTPEQDFTNQENFADQEEPTKERKISWQEQQCIQKMEQRNNNRRYLGIVLLIIGLITLIASISDFFPRELLTWPIIMMGIGLLISLKNKFRSPTGPVLMLIGGLYYANDIGIYVDIKEILWPSIMILVALYLIFVKKKPKYNENYMSNFASSKKKDVWPNEPVSPTQEKYEPSASSFESESIPKNPSMDSKRFEDKIDITAVLGGTQKRIQTQNFQGGQITCFLGGCQLDFTDSDIKDSATIDITCLLGGIKLLVPPNWIVSSQIVNIVGGIEDKRAFPIGAVPSGKRLLLTGTSLLGGIEIRS